MEMKKDTDIDDEADSCSNTSICFSPNRSANQSLASRETTSIGYMVSTLANKYRAFFKSIQ